MKRILRFLVLSCFGALLSLPTLAQQKQILCSATTPCGINGPTTTHTGTPAWQWAYYDNFNFGQLYDMFGATGLLKGNGGVPNTLTVAGVGDILLPLTGSNILPANGQILIGNGTNFSLSTLTPGSNITITNGPGSITISSAGGGGGTPGGSSYSIQFNNAGSFGGLLPGSTGTWCLNWSSLSAAPTLLSCPGGGTVTSFAFTNGNGFMGIVSNSTTTPTLSLTPSFTGWAYSNGTSLGAATLTGDCSFTLEAITCLDSNGVPIVTTTGTQTLTNKSISGGQITSAVANATTAAGLGGSPTSGQFWGYNGSAQGWYTPTGSGTVNSATSGDVACYLATGTAVSGCSLANGLTITSGVLGITYAINAQTGTTYTIASTDLGKLVTFNNASAVAVTLPQATGSFSAGTSFDVENLGAGTVTITPTTSTINGAATLAVAQNKGCSITSDGTNWQVSACTALVTSSSSAFNSITTGTNTTATMTVGSGGTLTVSGTGVNNANEVNEAAVPTSATVLGSNSSNQLVAAPTVTYLVDTGTQYTISGTGACSTITRTGTTGTSAGKFRCTGTTGASTITITLPTASNGWSCWAHDITTPADTLLEGAGTTTTDTFSSTSTATNDYIKFGCIGF